MKKLFTIVAIAAAVLAGNMAKAQVSVNAGYVQNNIITSATVLGTTISDTMTRPGCFVGVNYDYTIQGGLGVSLGANVEYFTQKDTVNVLGLAGVTANFTEIDLVIPVHLTYTFNVSSAKLTLFAGPTVNFGLVNKTNYHAQVLGVSKDWSTNWFENEDSSTEDYYTERFRWGVTGGARLDFGKVGLRAGYTMGISDNYASEARTGKSNHLFAGVVCNL